MALSKRILKDLIENGEIIISPYNAADLLDNRYIMHNNGVISYYEDDSYARNTVIDSAKPPKMINTTIPANGYCLEPNRIYYLVTKESVKSEDYCCSVSPHRELASYGLSVTTDSNIDFTCTGPVTMMLTSIQPVTIYPGQILAELYVEVNDPGGGNVPIGGIIMWSGGTVPYGYALCNGKRGTPDLTGKFVMGIGGTYSNDYDRDNNINAIPSGYETGGQNMQTLSVDQMPAHSHRINIEIPDISASNSTVSGSSGSESGGEGGDESGDTPTPVVSNIDIKPNAIRGYTESSGGGQPFDNRPAYYALAFIMRYK